MPKTKTAGTAEHERYAMRIATLAVEISAIGSMPDNRLNRACLKAKIQKLGMLALEFEEKSYKGDL